MKKIPDVELGHFWGRGGGGGQNILYGVFNFSEYVVFIK